MVNIGDVLFQLFSLLIVIILFVLIAGVFRTFQQRKKQLDRIEVKLDTILKEKKNE